MLTNQITSPFYLSLKLANNNILNTSVYTITVSFLVLILIITCLALYDNKINNSKYLENKTLFTILFSVTMLLILLVYGLTIFSYAYKAYKLMQGLFMENKSDSEKKMAESRKNSPKQKSASFSGGGDSDDSDKTPSSKKRKREDDEEIITKQLKKRKIENSDSFFKDTEELLVEENKAISTEKNISNNNSSASSTSEEAERTISYAEKGKARFVPENPQEEVYFSVPSEYDDPTAWLSEEELYLAKLHAKEFVEFSVYETYLEVDDNNNGHFLKATNAFQDLIEGIKYERVIPLSVRDCIYALARETVFWSEVVDCFVEKYQDMPD